MLHSKIINFWWIAEKTCIIKLKSENELIRAGHLEKHSLITQESLLPECFKWNRRSVIFGDENEFVFFSFFAIESDLSPNLSSFRVDAERLGLADIFVVHFEEVSEENVFFY